MCFPENMKFYAIVTYVKMVALHKYLIIYTPENIHVYSFLNRWQQLLGTIGLKKNWKFNLKWYVPIAFSSPNAQLAGSSFFFVFFFFLVSN